MSGHSKWSTIKRAKAVTDQRRGNLFTKLSKNITIAAKQGGGDQDMNFKLRLAVDKAKNSNMPNDNIDRAIKRGIGELKDIVVEEVIYEGFGPDGIAIIIEVATDNKNRSASAIRSIFTKNNGNLGNSGSVMWMFAQKGIIRILKENIKNKDEFELNVIDNGAEDIIEEDEGFVILSEVNSFKKIKDYIEQANIVFESADIEMIPNDKIKVSDGKLKTKLQKLFDELEDNEDVNNFYTNADF
ncbi:MAG: YebC/PmpR family DNA-binding transcriptional regulator [Candidatus Kerfeldbacteria bacterium]|jgi:YebC/PmpR family DNA-binding regulatory protein